MKQAHPNAAEPFSRLYPVDDLHDLTGSDIEIAADVSELRALAEANNLPAVHELTARFRVVPEGRILHIRGEVSAVVTQICVVTLEPFEAKVDEEIDMRFAPEARLPDVKGGASRARETNLSEEGLEHDPPEAIVGGKIDLGAVAAEFFTLGLDPYPRKPGAEFAAQAQKASEAEDRERSPFAALARLKGDGKGQEE